jgi:uncharacterized protein (DUF2147 family)
MKKYLPLSLLYLLLFCNALIAQDIGGFWKSINEKTGMPQCVVAVYEYEDLYYGRIVGTFDENGKMDETIYKPKGRAPGVAGNPFYCGLDIIWYLENGGSSYNGKILDPEKGNVYRAEVWREGDNLIVRGKLLFFGRSQAWVPSTKEDFPKGFKMPDLKKMVPAVPEVN